MKATTIHLVLFLTSAAAIVIPTKTAVAASSAQTPTSFNITNVPPPTGGDQGHDQDTDEGNLAPWEQSFCSMKHHHKAKSSHHKMEHPAHLGGKDTKGKQTPAWQRCKKHLDKHLPPERMEGHGECFKKCVGFKLPFISKLIPEGMMEPVCEGICGCKGSEQCKGQDSGGEEKPKEENPPVPYEGMNEMNGLAEWIAKEKGIEPAENEENAPLRSVGDVSTAHV
ncbi:hypothetical protein COL516b_002193 [Colletotrichum fioriniae]|nr:uncharacterized protein COL516b_002193 [Colletotrichum fioriniae]KAJ0310392.1 hypothetical protein COL516b_002193 [Colletotrichum fioriniae]